MLSAALGGYANLGYTTTAYSGTAFSKTQVLARTLNDWGFYVHSTGWPDSCVNRAPSGLQTAAQTAVATTISARPRAQDLQT
jgi:hypothetical protein